MVTINFSDGKMPGVLMDVSRDSIIAIFSTILGVEPKLASAGDGENPGDDGVVGIISFMGDVNYIIMLTLPKDSAIAIASKFCGFDIDYDSPDMGDVVGELANVLAGDIVARMSKEGFKVSMSLPTIMRGKNVEPLLHRGSPLETLNFSMAEGNFTLKVAGAKSGDMIGQKPGA